MTAGVESRLDRDPEIEISLVQEDVLFRIEKVLGLIPRKGSGLIRRVLIFSLLGWLPVVLAALYANRAFQGQFNEPLLAHFGIHVRLLLAVPAFILGEAIAHKVTTRLLPQFVSSGVVPATELDRFKEVIRGIVRLRSSTMPWLVMGILILAWFFVPKPTLATHELIWAQEGPASRGAAIALALGGWWYAHVARPIFQILLFAWLWRLVLLTVLLVRISKLELQLMPLHPDRLGGLRFIEAFPRILGPFAFGCSATIASQWAHEVFYHGANIESFRVQAIVFVVVMLLICLAPLMAFVPRLAKTRRLALIEYGALVGDHSRLVHRKWIQGQPLNDDTLLRSPELGPTADVATLFNGVSRMTIFPISKIAIITVAIPVLVPLLAVFSMDVPVGKLLGRIVKTLL